MTTTYPGVDLTYKTRNRLGGEPTWNLEKYPDGLDYDQTFRFLPPSPRKWWFHGLQKGITEVVFTLIVVFGALTVRAGGADILVSALAISVLYGGLFYTFFNYGKPSANPVSATAFFVVGHDNWQGFLLGIAGQLIGAFLGLGLAWAFIPVDGGVVPPVLTSTLTLGKVFGWELLVTFILGSVSVWAFDRLFAEIKEREDRIRRKKLDGPFESEMSDAPAGIQNMLYSFTAGRTSISITTVLFVFYVAGYLFHGAPSYTVWLWVAHAVLGAAPAAGVMTMGQQFLVFFVAPWVGAFAAGLVYWAWINWTRYAVNCPDDKCEKDAKLWIYHRY